MRRIGIVGCGEDKFTLESKEIARRTIRELLMKELLMEKELIVVSGHSPMKGIDILAEEVAKELGLKTEIYAPEVNQWEDLVDTEDDEDGNYKGMRREKGFKSRNIQIAEASDVLYVIVAKEYPSNYVFQPWELRDCLKDGKPFCYHCAKGCYDGWDAPESSMGETIVDRSPCMKCNGKGCGRDHTKSGACWTGNYAEKLGKKVVRIII